MLRALGKRVAKVGTIGKIDADERSEIAPVAARQTHAVAIEHVKDARARGFVDALEITVRGVDERRRRGIVEQRLDGGMKADDVRQMIEAREFGFELRGVALGLQGREFVQLMQAYLARDGPGADDDHDHEGDKRENGEARSPRARTLGPDRHGAIPLQKASRRPVGPPRSLWQDAAKRAIERAQPVVTAVSMSDGSTCWFSPALSFDRSSSPSHQDTTTAATPLPVRVGERAAFAHELVDAEHDRHAGNRAPDGPTASVAASVMKPAPVMPLAPFDVSMATTRMVICSPKLSVDVQRLRDEQRRQRHVDVGAVEVERIARRHDEADHRLRAAEALELLHHLRQRALRRRRAQHDQQFVLDVADELEDREARNPAR